MDRDTLIFIAFCVFILLLGTVLAAAQGADGKNGGRSEYCR